MIGFDEYQNDRITIDSVFAEDGLIAEKFERYQLRKHQVDMSKAVDKAFKKGHNLVAEAGTGVGKSFAYLVPAITNMAGNDCKVVISTHTITLQEQLINKDIPFLASVMPFEFKACLAKGRSNYLCKRRLEYSKRKNSNLFDEFAKQLYEIEAWANETNDGSLSDLENQPSMPVWDSVCSEHGNCRGRKCSYYKDCFYWRARRRLEQADVIIANHALLFSDLILKRNAPKGVLPDYQYIIVDEAHNIESVAESHFGINISNFTFSFLMNKIYNAKTKRGAITFNSTDDTIEQVKETNKQIKLFFRQIEAWAENSRDKANLRCPAHFVDDNITDSLKALREELKSIVKNSDDDDSAKDEVLELQRHIERLAELELEIKVFLNQGKDENVYWVEIFGSNNSRRTKSVRLRCAPVKVASEIKSVLFDNYQSVILTSATLNSGRKNQGNGFDFFAKQVGLDSYKSVELGSPYDYHSQVTLYVERTMPMPSDPNYISSATKAIEKYITQTGGKAFVLFTSYSMLKTVAANMESWFDENGFELLQQGQGIDRTMLLTKFKADTNSVLFGTDSFWQGVDVPGQALSNVIITKLPFAVPNHPLTAGKIERIRKEGGNPFFDFQLPWAVIKFKQGFGRLIRSHHDKGIVVLLDSRVATKAYGKLFIDAIPKCKQIMV